MALVKKNIPSLSAASFHDNDANRKGSISVREAEAQRKRARTLAKQQQAAERIAAATGELSSGINEAASASEQLRRAANQISAGAEEASGAAQESTSAFHLVTESIGIQLQSAEVSESKVNACQLVITSTSSDVANLIANVTEAGQRNDRRRGSLRHRADPCRRLQSAELRHADIHEHHRGAHLAKLIQRLARSISGVHVVTHQ